MKAMFPDIVLSCDGTICAARMCPKGSEHTAALQMLQWCYTEKTGHSHHINVLHAANGRPYLSDKERLNISLSTCSGWASAAVSDVPVGVDIEAGPVYDDILAKRICTAEEYKAIITAPDSAAALYVLWTQKESVLKCLGTGLQSTGQLRSALTDCGCETKTIVREAVLSVAIRRG